ncbi:L-histidine N(alpha)-methyltransferase [Massilia sp. NEAU-DD11]|uniref:L-histidine N(Alpha)-methyltransferase n=1 Tax=Massilia cellulosiltytica TaxID=2683234 RepID=A0A7X3FZ59_9BURK|nr:L-histidine N(alpha)-methyltransferase [Telluria cellulosilytica]MVW60475.1 L-histidine N(alpha)-methyltransferase [Telluria cellulosilytica]
MLNTTSPAVPVVNNDGLHIPAELAESLSARQPWISPKFLYDPLGSKLFEAICELPEYYPTRTEADIFDLHGPEIARTVGTGATLIDLGAGNCAKAANLFPLLQPRQYVPVDISAEFLLDAVERLRQRFRHIEMRPLGMDFSGSLELPDSVREERRLFFYPGSSIGNFTPDEARDFLQRVHAQCGRDGGLLIGIDLAKEHAVLDAAYDDALGVTAAFNLNVLRHVNRLLGADFDIRQWRHRGFYNPAQGRVEMHLEAQTVQQVTWRGGSRRFAAGEWIHTENSYKYRQSDAVGLLAQAGFAAARVWTDPKQWFAVIYARALSH